MKTRKGSKIAMKLRGPTAIQEEVSACTKGGEETYSINRQDHERAQRTKRRTCRAIISSVYSQSVNHEKEKNRQVKPEQEPDGKITGHPIISSVYSLSLNGEEGIHFPVKLEEEEEPAGRMAGHPVISSVYSLSLNHEEGTHFPVKLEQEEPAGRMAGFPLLNTDMRIKEEESSAMLRDHRCAKAVVSSTSSGHAVTASLPLFCIKEEEESYPIQHPDSERRGSISSTTGHLIISGVYSLSVNEEEETHSQVKLEHEPDGEIAVSPLLSTDKSIKKEELNASLTDRLGSEEAEINTSSGHAVTASLPLFCIKEEEESYPIPYPDSERRESPSVSLLLSTDKCMKKEELNASLTDRLGAGAAEISTSSKHAVTTSLPLFCIKEEEESYHIQHPDSERRESPSGHAVTASLPSVCIKEEEESYPIQHPDSERRGSVSSPPVHLLLNVDKHLKKEESNASLMDHLGAEGAEISTSSGHAVTAPLPSFCKEKESSPIQLLDSERRGSISRPPGQAVNQECVSVCINTGNDSFFFNTPSGHPIISSVYSLNGNHVNGTQWQVNPKQQTDGKIAGHPIISSVYSLNGNHVNGTQWQLNPKQQPDGKIAGHPIISGVYSRNGNYVNGWQIKPKQQPDGKISGDGIISRKKKEEDSLKSCETTLSKMLPAYYISINQHDYLASPFRRIVSSKTDTFAVTAKKDNSDTVLKQISNKQKCKSPSASDTEEHDDRWTPNSSTPSASDTEEHGDRWTPNSSTPSASDTEEHGDRWTQNSSTPSASDTEEHGEKLIQNSSTPSASDTEEHGDRWTQNSSTPSASNTEEHGDRWTQNSSTPSASNTEEHGEKLTQNSCVSTVSKTRDCGRRLTHNFIERQRRTDQRLSFRLLWEQIVELPQNVKVSKVVILSKAAQSIRSIQAFEHQLIAKKKLLKQKRLQLERRLIRLRESSASSV